MIITLYFSVPVPQSGRDAGRDQQPGGEQLCEIPVTTSLL